MYMYFIGNGEPWGNPCFSFRVRKYIKAIRLEQAEAHVTPHQAVPIFSDKIRWLAGEIRRRLETPECPTSFISRYIFYRDLAFFLCLWWAGDRAADLGRCKACEVTRIDRGDLLFNHTIGKTIRENGSSLIIIPRLDEGEMDPAKAVQDMVDFAAGSGLILADGYLFRPTSADRKSLVNKPFAGNNPNNRLKVYFAGSEDTTDRNLRSHGNRAGVAATLRILGATEQQVMDHCKWATQKTFKHYTEVEKVSRMQGTVKLLRDAVTGIGTNPPAADLAGPFFRVLNTNFKAERAFPSSQRDPVLGQSKS